MTDSHWALRTEQTSSFRLVLQLHPLSRYLPDRFGGDGAGVAQRARVLSHGRRTSIPVDTLCDPGRTKPEHIEKRPQNPTRMTWSLLSERSNSQTRHLWHNISSSSRRERPSEGNLCTHCRNDATSSQQLPHNEECCFWRQCRASVRWQIRISAICNFISERTGGRLSPVSRPSSGSR